MAEGVHTNETPLGVHVLDGFDMPRPYDFGGTPDQPGGAIVVPGAFVCVVFSAAALATEPGDRLTQR